MKNETNNNYKNLPDHEVNAIGKALRPHLDASIDQMKPGIVHRLAEARRSAVASLDAETATAANVNGGTVAMSGGSQSRLSDWRFWATGVVITTAIALFSYSQWSDYSAAREQADVDMMILGDDVPVDALLDKGFNHFLREEN